MNIKNLIEDKSEIDFIILLEGNYYPFRILRSKLNEISDYLFKMVNEKEHKEPFIIVGNSVIKIDAIIGWYFREAVQNPADKMIEFMEKKLPDTNEGNEWKN